MPTMEVALALAAEHARGVVLAGRQRAEVGRRDSLASGIRRQITSLHAVIEEMERRTLEREDVAWRLRAVEISLRRLREAA